MKYKHFLLISLFAICSHAWGQVIIGSGTIDGSDLSWSLEKTDSESDQGTLTISGTGAMPDFTYGSGAAPWYDFRMNITSVVIEDGVTSIGNYAFNGCSELTSVNIPAGVTSIGSGAFRNNGFASISLPANLTTIGEGAFTYCRALTSITIPAGVTTIETYVFSSCEALTSVIIPAGVTEIKTGAFFACRKLASISLPANLTTIGLYAFEYCEALTSVTVPASVTSIGEGAFKACSNLLSIDLESSDYFVTEDGALYDKNKTILIAYPAGSANTSLTIPAGIQTIGASLFERCSNLTTVSIPASVTDIGSMAFFLSKQLSSIEVDPSNPNYKSVDGVLYDINQTDLIAYPAGNSRESFDVPEGVTNIGGNAFAGGSHLVSVTIPEGVTEIKSGAFIVCDKLTSVSLPESLTSIRSMAFALCENLASVTIPGNVTQMESQAFADCKSLKDVTVVWVNPIDIQSNVFAYIDPAATLHVPKGTKSAYQAANVWKEFGNIKEDASAGIAKAPAVRLSVYPNPAKDEIFIKSDFRIKKVEIYALAGALVLSESNVSEKISVSTLPKGIYLLKVYTEKGATVQKVVKE